MYTYQIIATCNVIITHISDAKKINKIKLNKIMSDFNIDTLQEHFYYMCEDQAPLKNTYRSYLHFDVSKSQYIITYEMKSKLDNQMEKFKGLFDQESFDIENICVVCAIELDYLLKGTNIKSISVQDINLAYKMYKSDESDDSSDS